MKKFYSFFAVLGAAMVTLNAQTVEEYDFASLVEADTQADAVWGESVSWSRSMLRLHTEE